MYIWSSRSNDTWGEKVTGGGRRAFSPEEQEADWRRSFLCGPALGGGDADLETELATCVISGSTGCS